MDRNAFRTLVTDAVAALPEAIRARLHNIAIIVEDEPTDEELESVGLDPAQETLFGLYTGVPLPERTDGFLPLYPDQIKVFQFPLEDEYGSDGDALRREVQVTVVHELAHYFGFDDDELAALGWR